MMGSLPEVNNKGQVHGKAIYAGGNQGMPQGAVVKVT